MFGRQQGQPFPLLSRSPSPAKLSERLHCGVATEYLRGVKEGGGPQSPRLCGRFRAPESALGRCAARGAAEKQRIVIPLRLCRRSHRPSRSEGQPPAASSPSALGLRLSDLPSATTAALHRQVHDSRTVTTERSVSSLHRFRPPGGFSRLLRLRDSLSVCGRLSDLLEAAIVLLTVTLRWA